MTLSNRALLAAPSRPYRPAWAEGGRAMSVRKSGSPEYELERVLEVRKEPGFWRALSLRLALVTAVEVLVVAAAYLLMGRL
jgi:hypothetical protein